MKQVWHDLLFAHWPIDVQLISSYIPRSLELDTFEGQAWIGVVPFHMSGIRYRYMPPFPTTSSFAEINVRTYVIKDGIPGVYFFSLDAASMLAVKAARFFYSLPYYYADMLVDKEEALVQYRSTRIGASREYQFVGSYQPISAKFRSVQGSVEYWLTERYCLYTIHKNLLYRCDILHPPWELQEAQAEIIHNTMVDMEGFSLAEAGEPLLHFSERIEVLLWGLQPV